MNEIGGENLWTHYASLVSRYSRTLSISNIYVSDNHSLCLESNERDSFAFFS